MDIITRIEKQKNKLERVNIHVNNEFFCAMQEFVCHKHGLKEGMKIEKEFLLSLNQESDYERALNQTARLLSKMLKTKSQIITYLKDKGYDNNIVFSVVEKLEEYSYINDANYCANYIKQNSRKSGVKKLKFELLNKGVSKELVQEALQDYEVDKDNIFNLATKYLKNKEINADNLSKLWRHLASKGFDSDDISNVVNRLKNQPE